MTFDDWIKLGNILILFLGGALTAYLGYKSVKERGRGDAIKATSDAVVVLSNQVSKLQKENSGLWNKIDTERIEHDESIEKLTSRIIDLESKAAQLQNTANTQRDQLVIMTEQLDKAKHDLQGRDQIIRQLSAEVDRLSRKLDETTIRLNEALMRLAKYEGTTV